MSSANNPELGDSLQRTPGLAVPLLTDAEKLALFERDDQGVTLAQGIRRFPTFEDWQRTGGIYSKNNFWIRFNDDFQGQIHRETQWMQRFEALYPEQRARLTQAVEALFSDPAHFQIGEVDETVERDFWDAYEKIASLVDANDAHIDSGKGLPPGHADPYLLRR